MPKTRKNRKTISKKPTTNLYSLNNVIKTFLQMLNTIKLYHWKTFSYAEHKATDDLHAKLSESIDTFVEVLLGKMSDTKMNDIRFGIDTIVTKDFRNHSDLKIGMNHYKQYLIDMTHSSLNTQANSDLMNIRDEILGHINQFMYLLTLSK